MSEKAVREVAGEADLPSRVRGKRASMTSLTVAGTTGRFVPRPTRQVPAADFPPRPMLALNALYPEDAPDIRCVLDAGEAVHLTAGRYAIALGLKAMDVAAGAKVLLPAYHCTTMVEPLSYTGASPVFYRMKEDLSPDLDDVAAKIDPDTRLLVVTHYFGFPQDMQKIRSFCDRHGLLLLEDCAHAYFGEVAGQPLGSFGDLAIASPTKFFPLHDGGCLILKKDGARSISLRGQGARASLSAAIEEVQKAEYYGNLPLVAPLLSALRGLRNTIRRNSDDAENGSDASAAVVAGQELPKDFDAAKVDVAMSACSSWIYRRVSRSRIIARRRQNYRLLVQELSGLEGCRPFLSDLPQGVVPYEVPFWIDDLGRMFPRLEDMAVPMHRFGQFLYSGLAEGLCPLSESWSHHLVQFPCHQDLSPDDVKQIAARVRSVLFS